MCCALKHKNQVNLANTNNGIVYNMTHFKAATLQPYYSKQTWKVKKAKGLLPEFCVEEEPGVRWGWG